MNRRFPRILRAVLVLSAVALGASACVAYPAGRYGYHGGGWRAPGHGYAYAAPRGYWGGGYRAYR